MHHTKPLLFSTNFICKAHTGIDERETKAEMKRREMEEVQHKKQLELERKAEEAERRRQEHLLQIQQHKSR